MIHSTAISIRATSYEYLNIISMNMNAIQNTDMRKFGLGTEELDVRYESIEDTLSYNTKYMLYVAPTYKLLLI